MTSVARVELDPRLRAGLGITAAALQAVADAHPVVKALPSPAPACPGCGFTFTKQDQACPSAVLAAGMLHHASAPAARLNVPRPRRESPPTDTASLFDVDPLDTT